MLQFVITKSSPWLKESKLIISRLGGKIIFIIYLFRKNYLTPGKNSAVINYQGSNFFFKVSIQVTEGSTSLTSTNLTIWTLDHYMTVSAIIHWPFQ